jgi:hypothetical protein
MALQAGSINKSLLNLSKVIRVLSDAQISGRRPDHVPYRQAPSPPPPPLNPPILPCLHLKPTAA